MKAVIAKKRCIGCGLCTDICPSVFKMTVKVYAEVYRKEVPPKYIKNAHEAKENCPVSIISLSE